MVMAALVTLCIAEGQRAFFASIFGLAYDALFPVVRPMPALLAAAPLLVLLAPLLPLARWLDRNTAVAAAAVAVALFRIPMVHPALWSRLLGSALVLAAGAIFLTWAVGYLERRALAGGVVAGLVVDQLLRLAGSSYDLSMRPGWLPVQVVLSAVLAWAALRWLRDPVREPGEEVLERRSGGLRLRGGLALGSLLFMELHVLGVPPVIARWTGASYGMAGTAVGLAGAVAVAATLLLRRPTHSRMVALLMAGWVAGAALGGYWLDGTASALLMVGGHLAGLLLVSRALDPASGRREGITTAAALATLTTGVALYGLTFYASFTIPLLEGRAPWIFGLAGILLAGCFILMPRPAPLTPPRSAVPTAVLVATLAAAAVALPVLTAGVAPEAPAGDDDVAGPRTVSGSEVDANEMGGDDGLRVMTWNVHYGFDEEWRFDPGAMAEVLRREKPDVVALQEVLVGAPTAYGVDLPFWLGRAAGLQDRFFATVNGLFGDAFLTRVVPAAVDSRPLPSAGGDRKQLLRLTVSGTDGTVRFHALHLGVEEAARPVQVQVALRAVEAGPAVVMGDLNAGAESPVTRALRTSGYHDVFEDWGTQAATFPARDPKRRIDWIWVRGLRSDSAAVLSDTHSDHRAVVATLHILDRWIRSTDANDLQTP